jgi:hypothetical protein
MVNLFFRTNCSFYEIYPQSETPQITQIAHLDLDPSMDLPLAVHLLPDTLIWFGVNEEVNEEMNQIIFRVWDYRLNHSISFAVDVVEVYDSDLVVCSFFPKR